MVRALLDGRKSQTRRALKPPRRFASKYPVLHGFGTIAENLLWWWDGIHGHIGATAKLPYYPGDLLWVRETVAFHPTATEAGRPMTLYKANGDAIQPENRWTPSIYMPRWSSRLTLRVTNVLVQRVRDISCADAIAEGVGRSASSITIDCNTPDPRGSFKNLWQSINAKRGFDWETNPWVVAVTFETIRENIDAVLARQAA